MDAEVFDHFLFRHPHAGIADAQRLIVFVQSDAYFQRQIGVAHAFALALQKTHLFQRIRGVGQKFAQENFPVGVQGMGENI